MKQLILIIAAFLPLLVSAQSAGQGVEKRQSKMDLFVSQTGKIVKLTDYKTEGLSGGFAFVSTKSDCCVRKVESGGDVKYFYRIEKKNKENNGSVAYIEYADLLEVIRAVEKMIGEMDADILSKPDYFENTFKTVDYFIVGYSVEKKDISWFIRLEEYGYDKYLRFQDKGKDGGAYILDNFKKAAAMIEEMMRQDGTNAG